ncbi:armadillo-type protein, partial [Cladochytrium replicatum]
LRSKELIIGLLKLLVPEESAEVQDEAAFALANIARDFANKSEIRKLGGIKLLVKLLDASDPDVKKNSAFALSNLLEDCSNRAEIRFENGLIPLLENLASEHIEIQEYCLKSLIRCTEDPNNRAEVRKMNGVRRIIDLLNQEPAELHHLTLQCLTNCLQDSRSVFHDMGGISTLVKLLQIDDNRTKQWAAHATFAAARNEKNQVYFRDSGALPVLANMLNCVEPGVISAAAKAVANITHDAINQTELNKLGIVDTLVRLLGHDDTSVCRESVFALSSLSVNAAIRAEMVKFGALTHLMNALTKSDAKILSCISYTIRRFTDNQSLLAEEEHIKHLTNLVKSDDVNVCQNAAYALSAAVRLDLSAKYWLRNCLDGGNCIERTFYDLGSALGTSRDDSWARKLSFPSLSDLSQRAIDKKREILLVDCVSDAKLNELLQRAGDLITSNPTLRSQTKQLIRQIAQIVSDAMGGAIESSERLADFPYKFNITDLKIKLNSNVIPIGLVTHGTFYHRALLFKVVCDYLRVGPVTLVRGDYGRAWNVLDVRKNVFFCHGPMPSRTNSLKQTRSEGSFGGRSSSKCDNASTQQAGTGSNPGNQSSAKGKGKSVAEDLSVGGGVIAGMTEMSGELPDKQLMVDLMFDPGALLPTEGPAARQYLSVP